MTALRAWAAMGGYAGFLWPAYAVALVVLGGIAAQSWRRYRASVREIDRLQHLSRR